MIDFTCPNCGDQMSVPESLAGESEKCLGCGNMTYVPQPAARPPKKKRKKKRKPAPVAEATERQRSFATALGVQLSEDASKDDASMLIDEGVKRQDHVRHYVHGMAMKLAGKSIYELGISHNSVNGFITDILQRDGLPDEIAQRVIQGGDSHSFLADTKDPVYQQMELLVVGQWPTLRRRQVPEWIKYVIYACLTAIILLVLGPAVCNA